MRQRLSRVEAGEVFARPGAKTVFGRRDKIPDRLIYILLSQKVMYGYLLERYGNYGNLSRSDRAV